jgi:TatD DNase family protein
LNAPYLDIHTHRRAPLEGAFAVSCLSIDELQRGGPIGEYTSAGIHPWWTEDFTKEEIEAFKTLVEGLARKGKLSLIGETGIDRTLPETLVQQEELFLWHWDLAEKHHLPMVIHNVRGGSDFLGLLKKRSSEVPWIFHDFRGNEQLMRDLLRLNDKTYFSFGLSIDNSPQIRELLPMVPLEHLFLETDNQKHLDIHEIYIRAAEFIKMDLDFLKSQIWMNFRRISSKTIQ